MPPVQQIQFERDDYLQFPLIAVDYLSEEHHMTEENRTTNECGYEVGKTNTTKSYRSTSDVSALCDLNH